MLTCNNFQKAKKLFLFFDSLIQKEVFLLDKKDQIHKQNEEIA